MKICDLNVAATVYGAGGGSWSVSFAPAAPAPAPSPAPATFLGSGATSTTTPTSSGSHTTADNSSTQATTPASDHPGVVGTSVAVGAGALCLASGALATPAAGFVCLSAAAVLGSQVSDTVSQPQTPASDNTSCNNISGGAPGACNEGGTESGGGGG